MTSLIDVIFLLLLFFMLTSTFSKFAEVELSAAGSAATAPPQTPPLFLQLLPESLRLNGTEFSMDDLQNSALAKAKDGTVLLVSLRGDVTAQRLTDLLVALRAMPALRVTVLGV
ncbi:MAG: biopolymer transport protein ExbD [Sulfitobacter sp.]|jgi:biopolymer transport protein ExbD